MGWCNITSVSANPSRSHSVFDGFYLEGNRLDVIIWNINDPFSLFLEEPEEEGCSYNPCHQIIIQGCENLFGP